MKQPINTAEQLLQSILEADKISPQKALNQLQLHVNEPDDLAVVRSAGEVLDILNYMMPEAEENVDNWIASHPQEDVEQVGLEELMGIMQYGPEYEL